MQAQCVHHNTHSLGHIISEQYIAALKVSDTLSDTVEVIQKTPTYGGLVSCFFICALFPLSWVILCVSFLVPGHSVFLCWLFFELRPFHSL